MIRWFKVCAERDLRPGEARSISLFARRYAIFNVGGRLYGMDGACGHMKANLAAGRLTGGIVECIMHGWTYDVTTGACLSNQAPSLKTFPIRTEDNMICIGLEWPLEPGDA